MRSKILQLIVNDDIALLKWHRAKLEYERSCGKKKEKKMERERAREEKACGGGGGGGTLWQWSPYFQAAAEKMSLAMKEEHQSGGSSVGRSSSSRITEQQVDSEEGLDVLLGVTTLSEGDVQEVVDMPCFMVHAYTGTNGTHQVHFRSRLGDTTVIVRLSEEEPDETSQESSASSSEAVRVRMTYNMYIHVTYIHTPQHESFSARVSDLTHPELPT